MTGDAGNVTHNPNHTYIMKKALADMNEEGDKYCRFQGWPPGELPWIHEVSMAENAASGK